MQEENNASDKRYDVELAYLKHKRLSPTALIGYLGALVIFLVTAAGTYHFLTNGDFSTVQRIMDWIVPIIGMVI